MNSKYGLGVKFTDDFKKGDDIKTYIDKNKI